MNKNSRIYQNFQRVGGWCEPTAEIYPNGLVSADRKRMQVVSDGAWPLQQEAYVSMLFKRAIIVNLGGTAEVVISDFCPFTGQKSFLFWSVLQET